jgi:hypothetical protein
VALLASVRGSCDDDFKKIAEGVSAEDVKRSIASRTKNKCRRLGMLPRVTSDFTGNVLMTWRSPGHDGRDVQLKATVDISRWYNLRGNRVRLLGKLVVDD